MTKKGAINVSRLHRSNSRILSAKEKNNQPDSSFIVIERGGKKDGENKTMPRNFRHLLFKINSKVDLPHLRNAMARANQIKAFSPKDSTERIRAVAKSRLAGLARKYLESSEYSKSEKVRLALAYVRMELQDHFPIK